MHYFSDVLAFRQYLIYGAIPDEYLKKIEEAIALSHLFETKTNKSTYDDLLIKLFEASVRIVSSQK
jgi:hypothetical protein